MYRAMKITKKKLSKKEVLNSNHVLRIHQSMSIKHLMCKQFELRDIVLFCPIFQLLTTWCYLITLNVNAAPQWLQHHFQGSLITHG